MSLLKANDKNVEKLRELLLVQKAKLTPAESFKSDLFNSLIASRGEESEIAGRVKIMFGQIADETELTDDPCLIADAIQAWSQAYPASFPHVFYTITKGMTRVYTNKAGHGIILGLMETSLAEPLFQDLFKVLYRGNMFVAMRESRVVPAGLSRLSRVIQEFMKKIWEPSNSIGALRRLQIRLLLDSYRTFLAEHEGLDKDCFLRHFVSELATRFLIESSTPYKLDILKLKEEENGAAKEIYRSLGDFV